MSVALFGELRSLLQGAPSASKWERLCALCVQVPSAQFLSQWAEYIRAHTCDWPDALMRAPRSWCAQAAKGDDDALALLHIARDVSFHVTSPLSEARMAHWIASGVWGQWTRVHIKGPLIPRPQLKGLWASTALTHLTLSKTALGWTLVEALAQDLGDTLMSLVIQHEHLGDERGMMLCEMDARPQTLDLTNNRLSDSFVEDAITTGFLDEVEALILSENEVPEALSMLADTELELDEVVLNNVSLGDESLWSGPSSNSPQWRVLDVSENNISQHGIEALGELACLGELEVLDMSLNPLMEGNGLIPLLPCAPTLRDLTLVNSEWVYEGTVAFVEGADRFRSLRRLVIEPLELSAQEQLMLEHHPILGRALRRA